MANENAPEGYVKVKVPADANVIVMDEKSGVQRNAKEGESVYLSPATIANDPWLASHAEAKDDKPEVDPYAGASIESMRAALKKKDLPAEGGKPELMEAVRKYGIPTSDLEIVDPAEQVNKPKTPAK